MERGLTSNKPNGFNLTHCPWEMPDNNLYDIAPAPCHHMTSLGHNELIWQNMAIFIINRKKKMKVLFTHSINASESQRATQYSPLQVSYWALYMVSCATMLSLWCLQWIPITQHANCSRKIWSVGVSWGIWGVVQMRMLQSGIILPVVRFCGLW